ncbi:hypothetical protein BH11ACT2_BH11ACT2_20810 [soil metagenome]
MADKSPRVVAELGRPETPDETAARKAENSRAHRANQTLRNLVLSLIATVALVIVLVAVVVRPAPDATGTVDWHTIAAQVDPPGSVAAVDPVLPKGWSANAAELRTDKYKSQYWYIGFVTPTGEFVGMEQRFETDDRWITDTVNTEHLGAPGATTVGGLDWTVYTVTEDPGNYATTWESTDAGGQFDVYGSASKAEFTVLGTAIAAAMTGSK